MATSAQFRKLALSLPDAEEKAHFEQPDFRVRGKIFAGLTRDEKAATLKLSPEIQSGLLDARPEVFYPAAGAWGHKGWTHVRLARAKVAELAYLLEESWRLTAPKRLAAERVLGMTHSRSHDITRTRRRHRA
jgi:hypothetical protein